MKNKKVDSVKKGSNNLMYKSYENQMDSTYNGSRARYIRRERDERVREEQAKEKRIKKGRDYQKEHDMTIYNYNEYI